MNRSVRLAVGALPCLLLLSLSSNAHHSMAMFDPSKTVTVEGTVRAFQWTNPHIWIQLVVTDPATGNTVEWSIEGDSPNLLAEKGWTRKSLKPGDIAVVAVHPLRKGPANGGSIASVTVNGKKIGAEAGAQATP